MQNQSSELQKEYKKLWDTYSNLGYDNFHKMKVAKDITKSLEEMLMSCPGGLVLDGGCGTGMLFRKILDKTQAGQLIAGDFSDVMLKGAEKKLNNEMKDISDKIKLMNFDLAKEFPFPDNKFDAEVFNLSINYLPHEGWKQALEEAWRTTNHGGYVYVAAQTSDFDFSKGYKKEMLREIKEKLILGELAFIIWMVRIKKVFIKKLDQWSKEGVICYPNSKELVEYQKKLGFDKVEVLARPYFGTCIATRAHKP